MSRVTPRAARLAAWIAIPAALVASGVVVSTASYSAFSATTVNPTSNWTAGTVALSDDDNNTALFTATGLKPGSTGANCITVTSTGSLALDRQALRHQRRDHERLASNITLTVEQGTGGGFGSCSGFTPGRHRRHALHAAPLASFGTAHDELRQRRRHLGPDRHRVRVARLPVTYTVSATAPNTVQGGTASARPHLGGPEQLSRDPRPSPASLRVVGSQPAPRPRSKAVMAASQCTVVPHRTMRSVTPSTGGVSSSRRSPAGVVATLLGLALWAAAPAVIGWHPTTVMTGSMEPRLRPGRRRRLAPGGARASSASARSCSPTTRTSPDTSACTATSRTARTARSSRRATPTRSADSTPIDALRRARGRVPAHPVRRRRRSCGCATGEWAKVALLALGARRGARLCTVDGSLRRLADVDDDSAGSRR